MTPNLKTTGRSAAPTNPRATRRLAAGATRALLLALLACGLGRDPVRAQTPPAKPGSGRYLFVVETSSAMRPRAAAVENIVLNLLTSGMNGQLGPGDTIGVWTYNEDLYGGQLPLQRWTPENEPIVASNIVAFLKTQRYQKKARPDSVLPALAGLVAESEKLTVLILSDGAQKIAGTPFDRDINEFFQVNALKQRQKRMPIVTVLRAYRGHYFGVTLNLAPWPVAFPAFPPEPKITAQPKPRPPEKPAPPATAPPLIVSGKKPDTNAVAPPAPEAPAAVKPAEAPGAAPVNPPEVKAPAPAVESAPASAPSPPAPTAVPVAPTPTPPAAPVDAKPVTPPPKAEASPATQTASTPSATPSPADPPSAELPKPAAASVAEVAKPVTPDAGTAPVKSEPVPAADPTIKETTAVTSDPPSQPAITEPPPAAPPAHLATAAPPDAGLDSRQLVMIGGGVLVLAVALFVFVFLQRRARAASHASLITRSMDQDQK